MRMRAPVRDGLAVGAVALGARLVGVALTPGYRPHNDDRSYMEHGLWLLHTGHYPIEHVGRGVVEAAAYRPPGWPVALWATWWTFGPSLTAARVLLAVLGAGIAVLVALTARRLFGDAAGRWAGGLAAVCPPLIVVGLSLESEILFTALVSGMVLLALQARRGGPTAWRWGAAAGVLAGAQALTRTNGLVLIPLVALLAVPRGRRWPARAAVGAVVAVVALAVVAPWTVRNERQLHAFVPVSVETGNTLAGTYNPLSQALHGRWMDPRKHHLYPHIVGRVRDPVAVDAALRHAVARWVAHHPVYPLEVLWFNTARLTGANGPGWSAFSLRTMSLTGGAVAMWAGLVVTVALGLAGAVLARGRRVPWAWWAIAVVLYLSVALTNGEQRLMTPVLPFLCVLGGLALARLAALTAARRGERLGPWRGPGRSPWRQEVARPSRTRRVGG